MPLWTPEAVAALTEDEFSQQVLVPLFESMGYRDVRFFGGGVLEQGKDVVMWLDEPVRGRVNYAVVVKATAITGQAVTGRVIDQLRQAFGKSFLDTATQQEEGVHECFVVTPLEIKKEGTHTLEGLLAQETFRQHVTFIDGKRLWELIEKHLASRLLLGKLVETYQQLQSVVPDYELGVELNQGGLTITVAGESSRGSVFEPSFPDTPQGAASREAFEHFVRTGETTDLPLRNLSNVPASELLELFGSGESQATVRLRSAAPQPMAGSIRLEAADGDSVTVPYVEFQVIAGAEQIRFTNEGQRTPFVLDITARLTPAQSPSGNVQYAFKTEGWSAQWLLTQQKTLRILSKGARLWFRDLGTGIEHSLGVVGSGKVEPPTKEFFELAEKLAWVESRVKEVIRIPSREFFTTDDVQNLQFVETIVTKGQHSLNEASFSIQPEQQYRHHWHDILTRDQVALRFAHAISSWPVLDTRIPLGPVEVRCSGARVRPTEGTVEDALRAINAGEKVHLTVTPANKKRLLARYQWWYKR